jgi:dynein heavy chain, axonemal
MARVCGDLLEVAVVLDQFHKFLGPELKAVTGESAGIDDIMEVTHHYNTLLLLTIHY